MIKLNVLLIKVQYDKMEQTQDINKKCFLFLLKPKTIVQNSFRLKSFYFPTTFKKTKRAL